MSIVAEYTGTAPAAPKYRVICIRTRKVGRVEDAGGLWRFDPDIYLSIYCKARFPSLAAILWHFTMCNHVDDAPFVAENDGEYVLWGEDRRKCGVARTVEELDVLIEALLTLRFAGGD